MTKKNRFRMNAVRAFGLVILSFFSVQAAEITIVDGNAPSKRVSAKDIVSQVRPGQIILMGELHGLKTAQQAQLELLNELRAAGLKVSVGLEFFKYTGQSAVTAFRQGRMNEADFLKEMEWGNPSFDFYRPQALFPRLALGERTLAINAPRSLTGKISKQGLGSLSPAELALLPPGLQLGSDTYKARFINSNHHWPNPETAERYFVAQSVWDDTMAWQAAKFIASSPEQVLAITVGDFHVQYQDGLPARVQSRSGQKPLVFSFVNTFGMTATEVDAELAAAPGVGPRADFIWLATEPYIQNRVLGRGR